MGGLDFSDFFLVRIKPVGAHYPTLKAAKEAGAVIISYGMFINHVVNFVIVKPLLYFFW